MTRARRRFGPARWFGLIVVVAAATGIFWLIGMSWARALVLAVPVGAALALIGGLEVGAGGDAAWPSPPGPGLASAGWHHVALLGSTIHAATGDAERFNSIIAPRLRRLAEARLRDQGLRWDDPAARERLGDDVYVLLSRPVPRPPSMITVRQAIDRVEALGPEPAP